MRVKINFGDELQFEDILKKIKPDNVHFTNFYKEILWAVKQHASEDGYDTYDDLYVKYYYPIQIVFCDKECDNEVDIEEAEDWFWEGKGFYTKGKKSLSFKKFKEKYD